MKLQSQRLLSVALLIEKYKQGRFLADIGSDHAYLPAYLIDKKSIEYAYACDIAQGPLQKAQETINKYHCENQIEALLGNGLDPIVNKKVDMISICGMGGLLICDILEKHLDLLDDCLLFLQPNTAEDLLREFLMKHKFKIIDEAIILDSHHIYEILVCKKGNMPLTKKDILFGPYLRQEKNEIFIEKWTHILETKIKILHSLPNDHIRYEEIKNEIDIIEEVLS